MKSLEAQQQNYPPNSEARPQVKRWAPSTVFFLSTILLAGAYICWIDFYVITNAANHGAIFTEKVPKVSLHRIEHTLSCSNEGIEQKCITNYPSTFQPTNLSNAACPEYFRWIHEDLRPWRSTGITREMVERARDYAYFRLVIVQGKAYVEKFKECYETRDVFTIWGILQLLRLYPEKVPDLELMVFACEDRPVIEKKNYQGPNYTLVPPLFHYCGSNETLDIVFPDWTFWGWGELNVRPWKNLLEDIKTANKRTKWIDREPYAYWKGNPYVQLNRYYLVKYCNISDKTRLFKQNWDTEAKEGYKQSKLEDQCTHRYKIYIEGWAWSVSEKYILACDSMVLLVKPDYYDFFTRNLMPLQHYWHIRDRIKCRDVKFAVEWGNNHTDKAQAIGEAGSRFIQENVKMEFVYDYMFHLFSEYAKLLKFNPTIPKGAVEVCPEAVACSQKGVWKKFMVESMVKSPSDSLPCAMPPPYDPQELDAFFNEKERSLRKMEMWENEYYWEKLNEKKKKKAFHSLLK